MGTPKTRANLRYSNKVYDRLAIRVKKGTRDRWKDAAAARGLSFAALIVEAVEKYISNAPPPASPPATGQGEE